jgi:hypothetical protein
VLFISAPDTSGTHIVSSPLLAPNVACRVCSSWVFPEIRRASPTAAKILVRPDKIVPTQTVIAKIELVSPFAAKRLLYTSSSRQGCAYLRLIFEQGLHGMFPVMSDYRHALAGLLHSRIMLSMRLHRQVLSYATSRSAPGRTNRPHHFVSQSSQFEFMKDVFQHQVRQRIKSKCTFRYGQPPKSI